MGGRENPKSQPKDRSIIGSALQLSMPLMIDFVQRDGRMCERELRSFIPVAATARACWPARMQASISSALET